MVEGTARNPRSHVTVIELCSVEGMKHLAYIAMLALCGCEKPEWRGWVYPDKTNLAYDVPLGTFSSLKECRASALQSLIAMRTDEGGPLIQGDYECGYNCKAGGELNGLTLCERTER